MGSEGEAEPFLIELLVKRYSWFVRELNTALDEQGLPSLTRAQIIFLFYLEDGKDRSRTMSEKLGLSRQAVSLTARELESAGIIEFLPDPDKKSAKIIKITKSGKHSVGRAFNILRKLESRIARRAGKNELVAAKKLLNQDWG